MKYSDYIAKVRGIALKHAEMPEQAGCSDDCRGCWLEWINAEYKEVEK